MSASATTAASAFVNGRVLSERGFESDLCVIVEDGHIVAVVPGVAPAGAQVVDLQGRYLVPGFIDTQVNGGGDVLFNDAPTVEGLRRIAEAHRRFGTTGLMPTLISDDVAVMLRAIEAVRAAIAQGVPGILGIHLEGPYLASARKGVHNPDKFHTPDADELDRIASLGVGKTMLTLAPERFDNATLQALAARGVLVCAGHTAADYLRLREAFAHGVRGVTHLFNAMTPMGSREPGGVGAAIEDPDSWCGVIVDGEHVHDASLRIAIAAKPRGKIMLVTDAMPPVGGEREDFVLYGQTMTCRDGKCSTAEGTLAGSALDMAGAVRNTVRRLGLPLDEACRMASTYPAEFLGLGHELGRIAPGYRADLVVLDEALQVAGTWIGGKP
ncbi:MULTISPECIES: N-acetylglucosamine-6-phosphate deacetylase [unclassified Lysobacter]|uniref:N-acetylglucosamine-6-phosphate deacetylase n=1 Tax=unclassified Lysobacter TaxID=2635362 RepID=UPI0006F479F8|nr:MULTISPECIES: N-acetylglucosamine-6-phosphate deacetylase [unclassified Lysobacter]KQZ59240.1 N-acetylglucosamine-6-phosphate deacetylase [Lysobacter sp. Root559]KRC34463.1 N-acetylglucosamine-6-phosphate deacetylase [Lysobacter sp. Root76]KRD65769.1 N-acetylglucosamine-6-phosphate deacetylase [Lysobacter sp. Root96]